MEDEQGDVGPGSSGGVSEAALSGNLPTETFVENMGSENRVEESFEEGDGGEIMVEVVGSDVFVDGVSGHKECDIGSGVAVDLEGHVLENEQEPGSRNLLEAMDILTEGDGKKMGESEVGFSQLKDEKDIAVTEKVDASLAESVDVEGGAVSALSSRGDGVLDDEVWNPGIEAKAVSSSASIELETMQTEESVETTPVVVSEEKAIKDETVDNDNGDLVTPEPLNHPLEAVGDGEFGIVEKEEVLPEKEEKEEVLLEKEEKEEVLPEKEEVSPEKEEVSPENEEVSPEKEEVSPEKEEVSPEKEEVLPSTDNADGGSGIEAVLDGKRCIAEKEEVLPSTDNSASHDHLGADSVTSDGADNTADAEVDGIDSVVGEVCAVNSCAGGEVLTASSPKDGSFKTNDECASTDGGGGGIESTVDDKEVLDAESTEQILESDALVSDVQDENQGSLNDGTDGVSHASPESIHEKSIVSERGEAIGVEFDDVLDLKDGASNIDLPDLSSVGNDECLKTDEDLETVTIHQKHVSSNDPNQLADEGDTAEVNEDKGLNVEIQADTDQPNTMNSSCPGDEEIVQEDSGMHANRPVITTTVDEVIDDQKVAISQVEVVDEDRSSEKGEEIDCETSKQSVECQGNAEIPAVDASSEAMDLTAKGAFSVVETADVSVTEDHIACNNSVFNCEVGFDNVVEECGSPQSKEQEVFIQIIETSNHGVEIESTNLTPNEVASVAAVSDNTQVRILPEIIEKAELHVSTNSSLLNEGDIMEKSECDVFMCSDEVNKSSKANGFFIAEGHTSETKLMDVDDGESDITYHGGKEVDSELGTEEPASETDKLKLSNEETAKSAGSLRMHQSDYLSSPENEGPFAVSDLVWGKVRSHPWWPGQIFDPADASEKAVKYYKKDSYLVAYFGDRTFAWNDSSVLKPFRSHFSQIVKQTSSEAFQNAVNCALEEVSRRVELGLACSCIPKNAYGKIETQVVENTGIREESSRRYGVDDSSKASHFEPEKLLEFVRELAPRASSGADRLDLVIARAQLSAFCCFKGYRSPTEIPSFGELLENDSDSEQISDEMVASRKSKHTPRDGSQSRKERSLMELMGDREYSPDAEDESVAEDPGKSVSSSCGRKRKALDPLADGSDKRVSIHAAKVSHSTSQTPKPSFKIGECIRRVASQLTGSSSLIKGHNDEMVKDGSPKIYEHSERRSMVVSAELFSVDEMLSQLQLVAQDPKKGHYFQNNIHTFFLGFRSSIALSRRGRKKKAEPTIGGSGEEFEFDDVNDSYWTDRIVQNYSEEQLLHNSENGAGNLQLVPFGPEKSVKPGRKPNSRKRFSTGSHPTASTELDENVKRRKQESSPAELILNFAERNCLPSEINLNKMFRRFGPLMESETEIDHEAGRAKVIFKRGSDAEVARNSSEKFKIFGPVLVNYEIGYSPLISVKILPLASPQYQEDPTLML